jgi:hypothetical protein
VSYGKKWNHVLAAGGSSQATKDYGLIRINHDDFGARNERATWVRDSAYDSGGNFLTENVGPE